MTDERAPRVRGKTEASSILVAMHHGMWMVAVKARGEKRG